MSLVMSLLSRDSSSLWHQCANFGEDLAASPPQSGSPQASFCVHLFLHHFHVISSVSIQNMNGNYPMIFGVI